MLVSTARWGHWGPWRGDTNPGPLDSQLGLGHLFLHPLLPNSTPASVRISPGTNEFVLDAPRTSQNPNVSSRMSNPVCWDMNATAESQLDTQTPRMER